MCVFRDVFYSICRAPYSVSKLFKRTPYTEWIIKTILRLYLFAILVAVSDAILGFNSLLVAGLLGRNFPRIAYLAMDSLKLRLTDRQGGYLPGSSVPVKFTSVALTFSPGTTTTGTVTVREAIRESLAVTLNNACDTRDLGSVLVECSGTPGREVSFKPTERQGFTFNAFDVCRGQTTPKGRTLEGL